MTTQVSTKVRTEPEFGRRISYSRHDMTRLLQGLRRPRNGFPLRFLLGCPEWMSLWNSKADKCEACPVL